MKTYGWRHWCWKVELVSALAVGGAIAWSFDCARAQITPDNTLGAESSVITPNLDINGLPSDQIDGGAIREANLFHSFLEFNVREGRGAYFTNPAGIENILSRMTGSDPSDILGTLGVSGNANLFLINPNGILFGPNASLDVSGSFVASTASSLNFADGKQFSATAPQTTPLLTISVPIGLQYGETAREMLLQGSNLAVQPDKTLALVGGNVALAGGELMAEGGRIELGSVASNSLVSLTPTEKGWILGYEGARNFQDIQLSQQAVDASGEGGGDIQVQGRRVTLTDGSQIGTTTLGAEPGGRLSVTASESVELSGRSAEGDASRLEANTQGAGAGGNLIINTGWLIVQDGGQVKAATEDAGQGGTLTVNASESVEVIGFGSEETSQLTTRVGEKGTGDGGDLTVETRRLIVRDGAQLETGTSFQGSGGDLTVRASESVEMSGAVQLPNKDQPDRSSLSTTAAREAKGGNAGNLTVETRRLILRDGARINASSLSEGSGGNLTVRASESIELSGTANINESATARASRLAARTTRKGKGGNLLVETEQLTLRDGAQVTVSTEREGNAGNLTIKTGQLTLLDEAKVNAGSERNGNGGNLKVEADFIRLDNQSSIEAIAENKDDAEIGNAGNLTIKTGQLVLRNGAKVNVSATEKGNTGNLTVEAGSIRLDNQSSIEATSATGNQGNIFLRSGDLVLRHSSKITTNATGTATGGNITIDAGAIVALEDSDISANAPEAFGGRVIINAQGIFGTEFRNQPTPESDITATSNLGPKFSGTVEINTADVDLQNSLSQLSANFVSPDQVVAGSCLARRNVERGSFTVTGTGGLPRSPYETISGRYTVTGVQPLQGSSSASSRAAVVETAPWKRGDPIQEAQGMAVTADGRTIVGTAPQLVALAKAQNLVCHPN